MRQRGSHRRIESINFKYADPERLLVASWLAKRDVARKNDHIQSNVNASTLHLEQRPSTRHDYREDHNTTESSLTSKRPISRTTRTTIRRSRTALPATLRSSLKSDSAQQPSTLPTALIRKKHPSVSFCIPTPPSPACSSSPPVRDTDAWRPPSTQRQLHEPTARQLEGAKESHLRQLQKKMDLYTSALSDLETARSVFHSNTNRLPMVNLMKPTESSSQRGCALSKLKHRLPNERGGFSSFLLPRAVTLRPARSRSYKGFRSRRSAASSDWESAVEEAAVEGVVPNSPIQVKRESPDTLSESSVDLLWKQAVNRGDHADRNFMLLKPERQLSQQGPTQSPVNSPATSPTDTLWSVDSTTGQYLPKLHNQSPQKRNMSERTLFRSSSIFHPSSASWPFRNPRFLTAIDLLSRQLQEAEEEELEIRQRWQRVNHTRVEPPDLFPVSPETLNSSQLPDITTLSQLPTNLALQPTKSPEEESPTTSMSAVGHATSEPLVEGPPISFSKIRKSGRARTSLNKAPLVSMTGYLLRLPILLHRGLLSRSRELTEANASRWSTHGVLTAAPGLKPVQVCEWFVDELLEEALDEIVCELEHSTAGLIDEIVKGELFSEAPESNFSTSLISDREQRKQSPPPQFNSTKLGVENVNTPIPPASTTAHYEEWSQTNSCHSEVKSQSHSHTIDGLQSFDSDVNSYTQTFEQSTSDDHMLTPVKSQGSCSKNDKNLQVLSEFSGLQLNPLPTKHVPFDSNCEPV